MIRRCALLAALLVLPPAAAEASYTNFEVSHVHPIALTPSGNLLLAVNTPDARLEVFRVEADGSLTATASIPVGLEPVSVRAPDDNQAWVVNQVSDSVSVVDLGRSLVVRTLAVGDEPSDVAFASGKAFVAIGGEDVVRVFDLADLSAPPASVPIPSRKPRALAVAPGGGTV